MLNIITFGRYAIEDFSQYWREYVWLTDTESIEKEFFRLFNRMLWKEDEGYLYGPHPKFDTAIDLCIMKEIDHAVREDLLVVKTDIGTAPLTCLSTGCKFGLLVNYYLSQTNKKILASWGSAGENVFELLGRELNATIYMQKEDIIEYIIPYEAENILIDGKELEDYDEYEVEQDLGTVTSEKLKNAHRKMWKNKYTFDIPLSKTYDYWELHKFFEDSGWENTYDYSREDSFLKECRFEIRTTEINVDTQDKYPVIWDFRRKGDSYKFKLNTIYKYPNFWRIVCRLDEIYQEDSSLDEIFYVVFDTQGNVIVDREYPKWVAYSLVYSPKDKNITVMGVRETVKRLDDIAGKTEIEAMKD